MMNTCTQTECRIKQPSKVCLQCGTTVTSKWFSGPMCRHCYRNQPHIKERENKSRLKKIDHYRAVARLYCDTHKEQRKAHHALRYQANKEQRRIRKQIYRQNNKTRINEYSREYQVTRRQHDIDFRMRCALRSRLSHALKNDAKIGSAIHDLGCSIPELKLHLESLFKPGMTWDNYSFTGWHIDHIVPLSSFNLSDPSQFKKACHYTNLQPLWATENLKKSNKQSYQVCQVEC